MAAQKEIKSGDRRRALEAIRDALAGEFEVAEGVVAAALARELRAVLTDIEALPDVQEGSRLDSIAAEVADEVAERRARRFAGAAGS